VREERDEILDGLVDARPPARQPVAEALEHRAEVLAEVLVVEAEELVELHRLGGVGERDRRAGRVGLARVPELHLDVLEPERRAGAHDHARVAGQLLDALVELHVDHRYRPLFRLGLLLRRGGDPWLDLLDHAHPEAADTDLVAHHEVVAARELRPQVVGGHEGKPGVGLHGQENRHTGHEQGHRPHEDGACHQC
jgi:hypothetical protein